MCFASCSMPSCLYCRQCGTVLDEVSTVSHLQLDVYLELDEVPGSSTSSSFHVRVSTLLADFETNAWLSIVLCCAVGVVVIVMGKADSTPCVAISPALY